jgi:hypothetical protein
LAFLLPSTQSSDRSNKQIVGSSACLTMDTSRVDDEGLEEMWKEAQVEFRKLSGQDLANNKVLAVGDVLSQIQTKAESDEKASARYKRATDILDKTLNTIQNLGSLIASAASQVSLSQCLSLMSHCLC